MISDEEKAYIFKQKKLSPYALLWTCVPSVSATDGKADVGVLGSQPGLSPHSPEGEEDPGQDVGVPGHQTVTVEREPESSAETYQRRWPRHRFTLTDRRKKEEVTNNGTKSPRQGGDER